MDQRVLHEVFGVGALACVQRQASGCPPFQTGPDAAEQHIEGLPIAVAKAIEQTLRGLVRVGRCRPGGDVAFPWGAHEL